MTSLHAIEVHSIYLIRTFSIITGIGVHSIYLIRTFSIITGNRNAFHLPCSNLLPLHGNRSASHLPYKSLFTHHGQSKRIPFTLFELFASSWAIEVHPIYLIRAFLLITGNRNAFHLPCSNFLPCHRQSNHNKKPSRCLDSLLWS